jgi:hypothetical protein
MLVPKKDVAMQLESYMTPHGAPAPVVGSSAPSVTKS